MRRINLIKLKKIIIVKHLLIEKNETCLSVFRELFGLEIANNNTEIKKLEKYIVSNLFLKAINYSNIIIKEINSIIFKIPCPEMSLELTSTNRDNIQFCNVCKKNVYNVEDEQELEKRKKLGQCVRINLSKYKPISENFKNFKSCYNTRIDDLDFDGFPF